MDMESAGIFNSHKPDLARAQCRGSLIMCLMRGRQRCVHAFTRCTLERERERESALHKESDERASLFSEGMMENTNHLPETLLSAPGDSWAGGGAMPVAMETASRCYTLILLRLLC